ncbi:MAG: methyltransferase type 12, partial [Deltaproteobacteria bacterium]|nr:methyltransferase type 12 [Deltaproteobacteria bacterium]
MKGLPATPLDYGGLYQILVGPIRARLMMAGIELRIFNLLKTYCSAEDVARDAGTHPGNTRCFLDALVTIDLVEKKDGRYRNLPLTRAFLSEDSPTCLGAMFRMIEKRCVEPLAEL